MIQRTTETEVECPKDTDAPEAPSRLGASEGAAPSEEVSASPGLAGPVEALLFVAREPVPVRRMAEVLDVAPEGVEGALASLVQRYRGESSGVHLVEMAGGGA